MSLTEFSRQRLANSAQTWEVLKDFYGPLENYLLWGYAPGSFWSAVLANDWAAAICRSHPSNSLDALKAATKWIRETWPRASYGSEHAITSWMKLTDADRRVHLEEAQLIYTEQTEIMMALRGDKVKEVDPFWY